MRSNRATALAILFFLVLGGLLGYLYGGYLVRAAVIGTAASLGIELLKPRSENAREAGETRTSLWRPKYDDYISVLYGETLTSLSDLMGPGRNNAEQSDDDRASGLRNARIAIADLSNRDLISTELAMKAMDVLYTGVVDDPYTYLEVKRALVFGLAKHQAATLRTRWLKTL